MKKDMTLLLRERTRFSIAVVLCTLLMVAAVYAQDSKGAHSTRIGFQFKIGDKGMPAGEYQFIHDDEASPWITVVGNGVNTKVKIITRLAREGSNNMQRVVFDVVRGDRVLSEIWLAGQDGYLVGTVPESHKHAIAR